MCWVGVEWSSYIAVGFVVSQDTMALPSACCFVVRASSFSKRNLGSLSCSISQCFPVSLRCPSVNDFHKLEVINAGLSEFNCIFLSPTVSWMVYWPYPFEIISAGSHLLINQTYWFMHGCKTRSLTFSYSFFFLNGQIISSYSNFPP